MGETCWEVRGSRGEQERRKGRVVIVVSDEGRGNTEELDE